jgi:hypothetical protein
MSFDIDAALTAVRQGTFQPDPSIVAPTAPATAAPAAPTTAAPATPDPASPPPFDIDSALTQVRKGTYVAPVDASKPPPMPVPIGTDDLGRPIFNMATSEGAKANATIADMTGRITEKTAEGATMGTLPLMVGGVAASGAMPTLDDYGRPVAGSPTGADAAAVGKQATDAQRAYTAETTKMAPAASMIAEGAGALLPTMLTFGAVNPMETALAKGGMWLGKEAVKDGVTSMVPRLTTQMATNAGVGGVLGATDSALHDVGSGNTGNIGWDSLVGGGVGLGLGVAAPPIGAGVQWLWDGAKWVRNLAGSKGFTPTTSYPTAGGNADYMAPSGSVRATPQQLDAAVGKIEGAVTPEVGTVSSLTNPQTPQMVAKSILDDSLNQRDPQLAAMGWTRDDTEVPDHERTLAQQVAGADIPENSPGISHLQQAYSNSDTYGPRFAALQQNQDSTLAATLQKPTSEIGLADPYAVGHEFTDQLDQLHELQLANLAGQKAAVGQSVDALGTPASATEAGTTMKAAIDAQHAPQQAAADQAVADAQAARDQATAATPAGKQPIPGGATVAEQYGAQGRAQALAGQQASDAKVAALYDVVGNPNIPTAPLKTGVSPVYDSMPSTAAQPRGEEAAIQKVIGQLPDQVSLKDLMALRSRVGDEITREVQAAGTTNTEVTQRLMRTKVAIDDALNAPLSVRDAAEQQAVKAGQMSPEDTMRAKLAQLGQPAKPATATMTPNEAEAIQTARAAAQQHAQTFRDGVVGDILQPGENRSAASTLLPDSSRAKGGFKTPDADVMARVWNGKDTEAANLRAAQDAGITPELLKAHAADDLRTAAVDENGDFDPKAYARWRRDHAAGLHIYPEVKTAFDGMEKAQATLAAARENAAATAASHPLAGITDPAHVPDTYMTRGDDGAAQVKQFVAHTGGDPAAMQAFDDSFVRKMYDVPGLVDRNTGLINGKKLEKLTSDYSGMLSQRNELAGKLSNLKDAQDLYDQVKGEAAIASRAYQNGVAKNFLGGLDPVAAVQKVFDGPNSEANFAKLVDMTKGNPDALDGMRNAVSRYLVNKARSAGLQGASGMNPLKTADLLDWVSRNKPALLNIYGNGQGLNNIYAVMKELRIQSEVRDTAGAIPTGAKSMFQDTKPDTADHGVSGAGMLIGGGVGHFFGIPEEVSLSVGGAFKNIWRRFRQAGLESTDDLVATMLASPETTRAWRTIVQARRTGKATPLQLGRFVQSVIRSAPETTGIAN